MHVLHYTRHIVQYMQVTYHYTFHVHKLVTNDNYNNIHKLLLLHRAKKSTEMDNIDMIAAGSITDKL